MFLIVGLGNPGKNYEKTRHNAGFMLVDAIADAYSFPNFSSKFNSFVSLGEIEGEKVLLTKPQTFMNNSGTAVLEAARFYKVANENILVIHDDIDLAFMKIKLKRGGGSGGHNGIKSIDKMISADYQRLRIGVGRAENENIDAADFVLSNFTAAEIKQVSTFFSKITKKLPLIIKGQSENFLNQLSLE